MLIQGVTSVLPLLFLILLGIYVATLPWFGREGMNILSKLNLEIFIPIFMFYNVYRTYQNPRDLLELLYNIQYPFVIVLSSIAIGTLMAKLLRIKSPQRSIFINAVSFSNTVVMGMPVISSLYGEETLPVTMMFYASNTILYWTVGVWLLRRDVGSKSSLGVWRTVKVIVGSKPMLGFLLGIAAVIVQLPVPDFIIRPMSHIATSVTPLAMMFIGSVLRFADYGKIAHLKELLIIVGYRLLAVPVVTGVICMLLPVPTVMKHVFFIIANMPAMAQLPIMAKEVGSDYELASMITALTTACSMAAVPIYIAVMSSTKFLG